VKKLIRVRIGAFLKPSMTLLGDELRKAVALATDTAVVTSLLDNDDIPTKASGGLSASTVTADLQNAVSALQAGSNARIVVLCPPYALRCIAMLRGTGGPVFPGVGVNGGSSSGVEFIGTDSLDSDLIVLDASQAFAASDRLHLDTSTQADIEMSDDATDGTVSRHSLFQITGLRSVALGFGRLNCCDRKRRLS
jgi:hypothetical protein